MLNRGQSDQRIKALLEEIDRLRQENRALRRQLASGIKPQGPAPDRQMSPERKVDLFRSLFRGRDDVYAIRWTSRKTGKSGYSPARRHSRVASAAPEDLLPLTDEVVRAHLLGRLTVGIYPLLVDETCWFVAVDFDKATWREDSAAFRRIAGELAIPVALERSRSGDGAHAWIFFQSPLDAHLARKLATALLTGTLEDHYQLGLDSYDRLFPSQDTLPKGGFGNLIALPLQGQSRRDGNTVFLDDRMEPVPDQWAYLRSVERIDRAAVRRAMARIEKADPLIGAPGVSQYETVGEPPSDEATDGKPQPDLKLSASHVEIVQANRLQLEKDQLSPRAINQLMRLASFQNPEFYRFQAMRLSTFGKPRVICCAQDHGGQISIPRGCLGELQAWLESSGARLSLTDERNRGLPLDCAFEGELSPQQEEALSAILAEDIGVLAAPPGFGKTVVGAALIASRRVNTLVLVHRRHLMDQWITRLRTFLTGLEAVGSIGAGRIRRSGEVDVAMLQTLNRKGQVNALVADYGQVIVDECHHISAFRFEQVLNQAKARYVVGLTATPTRRDGHQPIIFMQCGRIRFQVDPRQASRGRGPRQLVIPRTTAFKMPESADDPKIQTVLRRLASDPARNDLIFNDVVSAVDQGKKPLLLTERVSQLKHFEERLRKFCRNVFVFRGGQSDTVRRRTLEALKGLHAEEERLILATGRSIGEGFDDPHLDALFLAAPISWKGLLQQYLGRLQRRHPAKREVVVYDYVDCGVPVLRRMYERRCRGYRALQFEVGSALHLR